MRHPGTTRPLGEAPAGGGMWRRRGAATAAVAAGYLLLSVALHGTLWADPAGRWISGNPGDVTHYTWWLVWNWESVSHGQNPLTSPAMNAPIGVSAMSNTTLLLPSMLLGWLAEPAGPVLVYTVLSTLAPALSALGMYACSRRLGLGRPGAVVAGLAFGFSPAVVNSLVGHLTMALDPLLPVIVLLAVEAFRTGPDAWPPRRVGLLLGVALLAQLFTAEEVLFQAVLCAALVLLVLAASHRDEIATGLRRGVRAAGWALLVVLPVAAYPLWLQFFGPLKQRGNPFLRDYFAADLAGFVVPTGQMLLGTARSTEISATFPGGQEEHLAYLGLPLIAVCAVTAVLGRRDLRVRCAAVVGLVLALLSLGGRIWVVGEWTRLPGPWALLHGVPVIEGALPSRFGVSVAMFAALLLGLAVDAARRRAGALAAAGLALLALLPLLPRPLASQPVPAVPEYFTAAARGLPAGETVLLLPYPTPRLTEPMRWQGAARHSFAMPGGYFLGPAPDGRVYVGGGAPRPTARLLIAVQSSGVAVDSPTPAQRAQTRADLGYWGADRVVLGPARNAVALRRTVTALLGRGPVRQQGVQVWTLP